MIIATTVLFATMPLGMPPPLPIAPPTQTNKQEHAGRAEVVETLLDVGWVGGGQSCNIIVLLKPDEGWHVYWKNPGASGAPTEIEISAPDGFVVGEPVFPRPLVFYSEEGPTHGYSEQVAIFIPVTAPDNLEDGKAIFQVTTSWLSCRKKCVIGEQVTSVACSTKNLGEGPPHRDLRLVRWKKQLPKPLSELDHGSLYLSGNTLHISGASEMKQVQFIGVERLGLQFVSPEMVVRQGEAFRLPVPIMLDFAATGGDPIVIEGLLVLGRNQEDPSYVVHVIAYPDSELRTSRGSEPCSNK